MRRGWMDWVPEEVPESLLRSRVAEVAVACRERGFDALVLYASFTRPAQVPALVHFVPFWSQALLVVTADGRTLLTMATTGRTVQWIRSTACVDEVIVGPEVGAVAGKWLDGKGRIGIAAMPDVPQAVLAGLQRTLPHAQLMDAQAWYGELEAGFLPPPQLSQRAAAIAREALAEVVPAASRRANAIVAAVEGHCRRHGAEEVLVTMAPDLRQSATLHRLEGDASLGDRFAVQASLAYKGTWLRLASSYVRTGTGFVERPECARARAALHGLAAGVIASEAALAAARAAGSALEDWQLEARRAGLPLACVAAHGHGDGAVPPHATLSLQLRVGDDVVLLSDSPSFS